MHDLLPFSAQRVIRHLLPFAQWFEMNIRSCTRSMLIFWYHKFVIELIFYHCPFPRATLTCCWNSWSRVVLAKINRVTSSSEIWIFVALDVLDPLLEDFDSEIDRVNSSALAWISSFSFLATVLFRLPSLRSDKFKFFSSASSAARLTATSSFVVLGFSTLQAYLSAALSKEAVESVSSRI